MKRMICIICLIAILLCLSGCGSGDPDIVTFYYHREPEKYQYFQEDSVICSEERDLLGHRYDLQYMAGLYLAGPMEEGLTSPFTKSTRLLSIRKEGTSILVELSDHAETLTDGEFSLSCACFALTCMEYTQCNAVTITSGGRSITMHRENIVLTDSTPELETNGG